jgi:hypothetical protein
MDRDFAFQGATAGWQRFLAALEQTAARIG